jgi:hypothetical protein
MIMVRNNWEARLPGLRIYMPGKECPVRTRLGPVTTGR